MARRWMEESGRLFEGTDFGYFQIADRRPTLGAKFQQLKESGAKPLIGTDSGIPMKFHG